MSVLAEAAASGYPAGAQLWSARRTRITVRAARQMMPFVPFVRVKNATRRSTSRSSEHGYRHTAIIHSRNLDTSRFGRQPNYSVRRQRASPRLRPGARATRATAATPTGEGITTPLTFTRYRRVMMTGSLRMI